MRKFMLVMAFLVSIGMYVVQSQTTITGTVNDENGQPFPGVNTSVKGTSSGTITDLDGNYSLKLPVDGKILIFTFVGYKPQEVEIGNQNVINVALELEYLGLEQVVVTAMGIQREKKALGYSVSTVNAEELNKKPESDIASSLSGKIAGVDIIKSSGVVGTGSNITIRGASSISSGNQPLFVVDGVPFDASSNQIGNFSTGGGNTGMDPSRFLDIDPNNIESVNVLKGLSASALYGERGRNGVILITTKTGSKDNQKGLKANLSLSTFFTQVASLPEYSDVYGQGGDNVLSTAFVGNWGGKFSENLTVPHHYDQARLANSFPEFQGVTVPYQNFTNNVKDFFQTGLGKNIYLNLQGGSENLGVNFATGYTDENGYIPNNKLKKVNASLGLNASAGKFTFSSNFNFVNSKYTTPPLAANQAANAVTILQRLLFIPRNLDLTNLPYEDPITGASVYYRTDQENPYWLLDNSEMITNTDRFFGNVKVNYKISEKLSASYQIGLDTYNDKNKYYINSGGVSSIYASNGYLREYYTRVTGISQDLMLNLSDTQLSENFSISAVAGLQIKYDSFIRSGIVSTNQVVRDVQQHDNFLNSSGVDPLTGAALDYESEQSLIGLYGQATMDFKDYIYLSITGRNDWGSTVEKENQSKFYPSASISVVPTTAFKSLQNEFINFMKIRFAYATSAGYPSPYNTRDAYMLTPQAFNPGTGAIPSVAASTTLGNPNLKPELHQEFEFGFDGNFLKNRISLELTYYSKISEDQILFRRLDPASGYNGTYVNLGRVDGHGLELNMGLSPIKNNSLNWTINNIFSFHRSNVVDTGGDDIFFAGYTDRGNFAIEGKPLGVMKGDYAPRDENGNYLINPNDGHIYSSNDLGLPLGIIGDPTPDFRYNIINTITYKGISFSAQIDWSQGGDFYSGTIADMLRRGVTKDTEDREQTYVIPGVLASPTTGEILTDENGEPLKNYIQLGANDVHFLNMNDPSGQSVYDATFVRLRELSISYTFPKKITDKLKIGGISISASGQNLWYYVPNIPKYTRIDPEVCALGVGNGRGFEEGTAPTAKKFGFTIKANF